MYYEHSVLAAGCSRNRPGGHVSRLRIKASVSRAYAQFLVERSPKNRERVESLILSTVHAAPRSPTFDFLKFIGRGKAFETFVQVLIDSKKQEDPTLPREADYVD